MRLYGQDADLWEALRDQDDLIEEGAELWRILSSAHPGQIKTILELGCGCGPLAGGFPSTVDMLLTDLSPDMLAISRKRNPLRRHCVADMRHLQLSEQFDVVLIHDAIMYLTDPVERFQALSEARRHLKDDGLLLLRPDVVAETFSESLICGGGQANGKTVALTEWRYDADTSDDLFSVAFSVMVRKDGLVNGFVETHLMTLLTDNEWRDLIKAAGFTCIPTGFHNLEGPVLLAQR